MDKIRLGQTGVMVSRVGLGGIPIQRVTEDEAVAVVKRCLELGVNFIDTSHVYGTSEERIGKAIAGRRDGLFIATKSTSRTVEGIKRDLDMSLERMGIESIDLYQFHNVKTPEELGLVLDPDGPWSLVAEAKKAGIIKHIGITSHSPEVAKEAAKTGCFETIMIPFNFINYLPYVGSSSLQSDELLPLIREKDIGLIAMKPLAGGRISNVTIAFKYLFQFPGVLPLVGIEKEAEIDEIAAIAEAPSPLSEAEKREMARSIEELGSRFCRQCSYCQPC